MVAETVERACADRFAGACHDTLRHVARGRLGERQYENFFRGGALRGEQPCDISDNGGGFACSRAREHEGIVARSCDCTDLLVAQIMLFDFADDILHPLNLLGREHWLRHKLLRRL